MSHTINSSPVCRPPTWDLWCCVTYIQFKPCPQTPYQGPLELCLIQSTQALSADPLSGTSGAVSHTINSSPVRRPLIRDLWSCVSYNQLKPCPQTPYQGPLELCLIQSTQALSADPLPGTSSTVSHTINSSPVRRPLIRDLWHCVSYNQLKPCPQTPYQGPLVLCLIQSTQAPSIDSPN